MRLPASVQEIAEVIGRDRALFLIGQLPRFKRDDVRGGEQVILYVPRGLKPDHYLVRILGWPDAQRMVDYFGGELLKPGNCCEVYRPFRDQAIRQMRDDGVPIQMIAEWFGMTERRVRQVLEISQEVPKHANDNNSRVTGNKRKRDGLARTAALV